MSYLILTRHGESEYNAKSLWTGWIDSRLSDKGRHEASLMAQAIRDITPRYAFTSLLSRANETLDIILRDNHWDIKPIRDSALNERSYGDLAGLNKWEVQKDHGKEQFDRWRRGWDEPIPGGETLKMVYQRAIPYYEYYIRPYLKQGSDVIITAHGNSLRALIKYFDHLSDEAVQDLEMPFGQVIVYDIASDGTVTGKEIRHIDTVPPPA